MSETSYYYTYFADSILRNIENESQEKLIREAINKNGIQESFYATIVIQSGFRAIKLGH